MNARWRYIIGIIGGLILIAGLWCFRHIIAYILISAALSILGQPIVRFLAKIRYRRFYIPNALCAALTLVLIWAIIFTVFRIFIPIIISEANELAAIDYNVLMDQLQAPLMKIEQLLNKLGISESTTAIEDFLQQKIDTMMNANMLPDLFTSLTSVIKGIAVAIFAISFITFFFLKDAGLFNQGVMAFVPDKYMEEVNNVLTKIRKLLTRYLGGILIDVSIVTALITFGLTLVGLEFHHAMICGLISGILNVIPYVGPWIGAVFSISIGVATNINLPFETGLMPLVGYMLLIFLTVQVLDGSIFQPLIYSNSVKAHPLEIFLVIMMAGSLVGIGGMVLAIPSYTVFRVIAKEFLSGFKVIQKLTRNI
jgi:predicted PurR-regulated permease PerM